ncbi:ComEC/Rec2 family competence protein [Planctomycetota bacterium]
MGYEVDFLAVGDESKSGDAIALRFGNLYGERAEQAVIVIDGGFKDDGRKLVEHIRTYYGTDIIDVVIATHPHGDHIAGLETILKEMQVKEFWIHKPWDENHTNNISKWFTDGRVTDNSVREALRKSLDTARELEKIATQKGIPIIEPFVGIYKDFGFGRIDIAGPTKDYYESLLPDFASTPESRSSFATFLTGAVEKVTEVVSKVFESWDVETLDDNGETSAENTSGAITLLRIDGKTLLFTGDAGISALTNVADLLEASGITNENYSFIQVPHHGSKRNVGPTILNRLIGPKLGEDKEIKTAFASCAKDGNPKHPAKKVTNAFKRRGASVHATQGENKCEPKDAPVRQGWFKSIPLRFYDEVEE